jgi:uncharacterized protein YecE (DUF72 family)
VAAVQEKRVKDMGQVFIGSMGWSYKQWELYKGWKAADYLDIYSQSFNSVEINNTFYSIPRESSMIDWASKVPDGFRFAIKFPRTISHSAGLEPDQGRLEAFFSRVQLMEDKAGPLLIQFPPILKPDSIGKLEAFLDRLPLIYRYAIEFRHKDWFNEETYKLLRDNNVALVNVEHPWQESSQEQTADFSYIRLEGDRKTVKGESGIVEQDRTDMNKKWSKNISQMGERDVYCYVSKHYSGYPPDDMKQLRNNIGSRKI